MFSAALMGVCAMVGSTTTAGVVADTDETDPVRFYDGFAEEYELAYGGNWESAMEQQGATLDALIRDLLPEARAALDCSCGIGTQAIALARCGYRVVGTDISPAEIDRARREAQRLAVNASFSVADFRDLSGVEGEFDVVISCDNAIPHLLNESDVRRALEQMLSKLRAGGLVVITMRDFDRALAEKPSIAPPVVVPGSPRRVLVRLHDWYADEPFYTVRFLVLTEADGGWLVKEHTTRYRAITRAELAAAATAAGFEGIDWPTDRALIGDQQVMTARRP